MTGTKRKRTSSPGSALHSHITRSRGSAEARVDPTYGQRSALPGLDPGILEENQDSDLSYDDDGDCGIKALSYLQSVRDEASTIPSVLVARQAPPQANTNDRVKVCYAEGIFYSTANVQSTDIEDTSNDYASKENPATSVDNQEAHINSILNRYRNLRAQLSIKPPSDKVTLLSDDKDHPIHLPRLTTPLCRWWRYTMRTTESLPTQLACMDKATIFRLISLLMTGNLIKKGKAIELETSTWVWGLLARLPDRGELMSEEIGVVRELGKMAVLVAWGLRDKSGGHSGLESGEWKSQTGTDEVKSDELADDRFVQSRDNELEEDVKAGDYTVGPKLPDITAAGTKVAQVASSNSDPTEEVTTSKPENRVVNPHVAAPSSDLEDGELSEHDEVLAEQQSESTSSMAEAKARILARLNGQINSETNMHNNQRETSPTSQACHNMNNDQATKVAECDEKKSSEIKDADGAEELKSWNTKATIDMILTIVGEVYGQRDLLEFRGLWST